ncbi:MAG: toll/interleukin-1 receptor domain-containing protein [Gammaproteobacteria bacterium]|nr:toll/interleukin-1 receptor domain-containing protein [Gammaproteobacteria bacterium]
MNIFVSYTRRDGMVTNTLLHELNDYLHSICTPFIHAVEEPNIYWQQLSVVNALFRSHAILLIGSPSVNQSPWVKFELFLAKVLLIPVLHLDASFIINLKHNKALNTDTAKKRHAC